MNNLSKVCIEEQFLSKINTKNNKPTENIILNSGGGKEAGSISDYEDTSSFKNIQTFTYY